MDKIRKYFESLSIKSEARAVKLAIATIIAVFISNRSKYIDTTTTCLTVYLVYAMFFTVSGSRSYAKQRILSNAYALVVSIGIGGIFKWNMYALALVFFLIMIVYFKFNLEGKISLLSTGAATIIFYVGGNTNTIVHRFIALIVGFIIAILTNELILPTNNGLIVENSLRKIQRYIFKAQDYIIKNRKMGKVDCEKLSSNVKECNENITLLEKEILTGLFTNHLRGYKGKVNLFKQLNKISNIAYSIIEYLDEEKEVFDVLTDIEKDYIIDVLRKLHDQHKILAENIINNKKGNVIKIEIISYSHVNFRNNFKIILMSKFLQYQEELNNLVKIVK